MTISPATISYSARPTPHDLVAAARDNLGITFVDQGRTAEGLDCLGNVLRAVWSLGLPAEDVRAYGRTPDPQKLLAGLRRNLISTDRIQLGAIVRLKWFEPIHLAIVTDGGSPFGLIHAAKPYGKVVEHGFVDPWPRRVRGIFLVPGIAY